MSTTQQYYSGKDWHLRGNDNVVSGEFLGTTTAQDLVFKQNSVEGARFTTGSAFYLTGDITLGVTPTSGSGRRAMWIPAKGAFRVGLVNGNQWDDSNIGSNSMALGSNVTASGTSSISIGSGTSASNLSSIAIGNNCTATGSGSRVFGGQGLISTHTGAMLLGDEAVGSVFQSDASNQLRTRFNGGYKFYLNDTVLGFEVKNKSTIPQTGIPSPYSTSPIPTLTNIDATVTVTTVGTSTAGRFKIVTSSGAQVLLSKLFDLNYVNNAFTNGSIVVISPYDANAANLNPSQNIYAVGNTTGFAIMTTTGLVASTTYEWNYQVIGY